MKENLKVNLFQNWKDQPWPLLEGRLAPFVAESGKILASQIVKNMNMSESLTSELWLKIDQLHLKYLQSEDNPLKLDIRKKLEGM